SRGILAPELVDDPLGGDGLAGVQDQQGQEGAPTARRQLDAPSPVQYLRRSQDAEVHAASGAGATVPPCGCALEPLALCEALAMRFSISSTDQEGGSNVRSVRVRRDGEDQARETRGGSQESGGARGLRRDERAADDRIPPVPPRGRKHPHDRARPPGFSVYGVPSAGGRQTLRDRV